MIISSKYLNKNISVFENKKGFFAFGISTFALTPITSTPPIPTEPQSSGGLIGNITDGLNSVGESSLKGLEVLNTIGEYMLNPALILIDFWNFVHYMSYPILLGLAMFSMLMYISGHKKFAKYIPSSVIIYTLIQAVGRF